MSTQNLDENSEIDEVDRISHAFMNYRYDTVNKYSYPLKLLSKVSASQKEKLINAGLEDYYKNLNNYAEANQNVLRNILKFNLSSLYKSDDIPEPGQIRTRVSDNYRITHMLWAIAKEWSDSGRIKRYKMWSLLLKDIKQFIDGKAKNLANLEDQKVHIVVPGAGVGRLPFEILQLNPNVRVTANEEDLCLFFANNFILEEKSKNANQIYPNIYDLVSRLSSKDVTTPVMFPDIDTSTDKNLSFTNYPESFIQVCENQIDASSVDCVVTYNFLDTAKNMIKYIELIEKILKPDGIWINMGGLQYMYEPYESVDSIEISYRVLKESIIDVGLLIEKEKQIDDYEYFLEDSNVQKIYKCPYFTCRKGGNLF